MIPQINNGLLSSHLISRGEKKRDDQEANGDEDISKAGGGGSGWF